MNLKESIIFGVGNSAGQPTTATITVVDWEQLSGATLTINGGTYTEGVEWSAEDSNNATAQQLRAAIAADNELDAQNNSSPVVTVTRVDGGSIGAVTSSSPTNLTVVLS